MFTLISFHASHFKSKSHVDGKSQLPASPSDRRGSGAQRKVTAQIDCGIGGVADGVKLMILKQPVKQEDRKWKAMYLGGIIACALHIHIEEKTSGAHMPAQTQTIHDQTEKVICKC